MRLGALFLLHVSGAARSARMEHAAHSHGAALAIYLGGSALPRCLGLARVAGQLHVAEGGLHTLRFRWPKLAVMRGVCDRGDARIHCFGFMQLQRAPPRESALLQSWTPASPSVTWCVPALFAA